MGALRLALAVMVVFQHIASIPFIGEHAVIFFFTISGYLMTLVLHKDYGYSVSGFSRFWMNRVLRLYPSYLLLLAISVVVLLWIPEQFVTNFKKVLALPQNPGEWLQNLTMVYAAWVPNSVEPRMSPATWAITIELFFYLLISLGISRTKESTLIWFAVSSVYVVFAFIYKHTHLVMYDLVTAGTLPFCAGAMLYHFRDELAQLLKGREKMTIGLGAAALIVIIISHFAGEELLGGDKFGPLTLLLTTPIAFMMTAALLLSKWSPLPRRWDKLLGDMSYPVYLSHWICGLAVGWAIGIAKPQPGLAGLVLASGALLLSLMFSAFVAKVVDPRVEHYRTAVRRIRKHGMAIQSTT